MKCFSFLAIAIVLSLLLSAAFPGAVLAVAGPHQPHNKDECKNGGWQNFPNAGFRNQGDCVSFVSTDVFVCRDALGCLSYAPNAPIRVATSLDLSGGAANLGIDAQQAASLALSLHGNLFGHGLELAPQDDGCNFDGGTAAANAIVADPAVAAVVGTICSGSARAAAPIITDAGLDMVGVANTAFFLTDPATHQAGYLRTSWNDKDNPPVMAQFLFARGIETSAVILQSPDLDVYGQSFVDAFTALGGTNLAVYDLSATDVDSVLDDLAATQPGAIYLLVSDFEPGWDAVNGARARAELNGTVIATNDFVFSQDFLDGLGANAEGMFFGVPDDSFTGSVAYANYSQAYSDMFGTDPLPFFSPYAFDATNMILAAIENTAVVDHNGTLFVGKQALRNALFATTGMQGLTGTITCTPLGECGSTSFRILTVQDGTFVPAEP